MEKICLKCGAIDISSDMRDDKACTSCGAIFAKVDQYLAEQAQLKEAAETKKIERATRNQKIIAFTQIAVKIFKVLRAVIALILTVTVPILKFFIKFYGIIFLLTLTIFGTFIAAAVKVPKPGNRRPSRKKSDGME